MNKTLPQQQLGVISEREQPLEPKETMFSPKVNSTLMISLSGKRISSEITKLIWIEG